MTFLGLSASQLEAWAGYILGNWILQSSLLLGLGLAVASLTRLTAGMRHTLALAALLLAAIAPVALAVPHPVAARVDASVAVRTLVPRPSSTAVHPPRNAVPELPKSDSPSVVVRLAMAWAAGCALRLLWLLGGSIQVAVWLRRSRRVDARRLAECCGYETVDLDVRTTADLPRPAVAGVIRPAILLPKALLDRADETLRPVLLHEGAHYRRRDPLRLLLAEMAGAILFWHPLAWALRRQLDRLAEEACDREVLARGVAPGHYARTLLELLEPPTGRRIPLACSLGRAGRELQRRIDALFISPIRPSSTATVCAAALVVPSLAGALSMETGARPWSPRTASQQEPKRPRTVRAIEPARVPAPVAVRPQAISTPVSARVGAARTSVPNPVGALKSARFEPSLASSQALEPVSGKVVVFLLDISSSMRPYQEAARRDLLDRVAALHASDSFNVVAFATEQHRFAPEPVAADETTRAGVEVWLSSLQTATGTCPLPALELALATPGAGSVVLISDTQTATGALGEQVQNLVRERNTARATVLAVTLGEPAASGVAGVPSPMGIVERVVAAEETAAPL